MEELAHLYWYEGSIRAGCSHNVTPLEVTTRCPTPGRAIDVKLARLC